ncbi:hypothetical protein POL68_22830 [Stigmatella sp. ncwal1]|uniref:Uncharacterized protein n=1 Tax=Stigmatella ashevillensis TaxID=2995309 RepID=A0ABT5DCH8_9BACT|nr:hypothetical protein [Stigmatella ashevillena]MDC0711323.1 hypothetical protein [Stigmatella ashevillena]
MSYSFLARFDTTQHALPLILDKLAGLLDEMGIRFQGQVTRLVEYKGWPTVDVASDPVQVEKWGDIAKVASQWWGLGLYCSSSMLARRLGRGDWMEVDFRLFRASNGKWTLSYAESKAAQQHRLEVEEAANELYELQLRLCAVLGFQLSVYDEEDDDLTPSPTVKEIEHRLEQCARGALGCSIVLSTAAMDFERAKALAGTRARVVRFSTGYTLFPFLLPDERVSQIQP